MNKGLKLRLCKECEKKRYCRRERIPGHNFKITCSKGHVWTLTRTTVEQIESIIRDALSEKIIEKLFNRDDVFYSQLKRR